MKLGRILCLAVIFIFIIQIYDRIIYGFETNNKIITHQTIEIGKEGNRYTLPTSLGMSGQVLKIDENNEMVWGDLPTITPIENNYDIPWLVNPYFKTKDKCPPGTCFLPTEFERRIGKWFNETEVSKWRGFCIITRNTNVTDGNCTAEDWNATISETIRISEGAFYCSKKFGIDAVLPPFSFFWPQTSLILQEGKEIRNFSWRIPPEVKRISRLFDDAIKIPVDDMGLYQCESGIFDEGCRDSRLGVDTILTREISEYGRAAIMPLVLGRVRTEFPKDNHVGRIGHSHGPYIAIAGTIGDTLVYHKVNHARVICIK